MVKELDGRVAVVTGSAAGLGRGIALALAECGAEVVINYRRSESAARDTVRLIRSRKCRAVSVQADVSNWTEVRALFSDLSKKYGKIDILINNVGELIKKPLSHTTVDEWHSMMSSNLNSTFFCCKAVLPLMYQSGYGRIINIALAGAERVRAYKMVTAYAIAKTGVLILTKSLAVEHAASGITVNAISPGLMDNGKLVDEERTEQSRMVPAKKLGSPDDIAAAIRFLVSEKAAYITGTNIVVSGGWGL